MGKFVNVWVVIIVIRNVNIRLYHSFVQAKDDDLRGDKESATRKGRISLILNIASVALTVVMYVIFIIIIAIAVSRY